MNWYKKTTEETKSRLTSLASLPPDTKKIAADLGLLEKPSGTSDQENEGWIDRVSNFLNMVEQTGKKIASEDTSDYWGVNRSFRHLMQHSDQE